MTFESNLDMSFRIPNYVYNVLIRLKETFINFNKTLIPVVYVEFELHQLPSKILNVSISYKNRFFNFFNDWTYKKI